MSDPRLGRIAYTDPRSANYPVRALLTSAETQVERTRLWYIPSTWPVLNQGERGFCVGCGTTNELRATPIPVRGLDETFAEQEIYWGAQRRDGFPGGAYPGAEADGDFYEGTTVTAGMEEIRARGYVREYRWAESERDLALAVGHLGPAVIGVGWRTGMLDTDAGGYLRPTGDVEGGHCVLVIGISLQRDAYTIINSWSASWGDRGRARIKRHVMAQLLGDDGEAAIITSRARPKAAA